MCCVARICVEVWFRLGLCLVAKLTSVKVVIALAANNASDSHSGPRERVRTGPLVRPLNRSYQVLIERKAYRAFQNAFFPVGKTPQYRPLDFH